MSAEAELPVLPHLIDDRETGHSISLFPQLAAAGLEAFFDRDSNAGDLGSRLRADIEKSPHRFSDGKKIIDQKHPVSLVQKLF